MYGTARIHVLVITEVEDCRGMEEQICGVDFNTSKLTQCVSTHRPCCSSPNLSLQIDDLASSDVK